MIGVLVTRPDGESDPLVHALRKRGYRVHAVPTVQTEAVDFNAGALAGCVASWGSPHTRRNCGIDASALGRKFKVVPSTTTS